MDGVGERGRRDGELVGFSMGILRASVPLVRVEYGEPTRVAQTPDKKHLAIIQIQREDTYIRWRLLPSWRPSAGAEECQGLVTRREYMSGHKR